MVRWALSGNRVRTAAWMWSRSSVQTRQVIKRLFAFFALPTPVGNEKRCFGVENRNLREEVVRVARAGYIWAPVLHDLPDAMKL